MFYPAYPQSPTSEPLPPPRNGLGTAGFVTGLVGAFACAVPVLLVWLSIPLGVMGIVFGWIGVVRKRSGQASRSGFAYAGIALGVVALVLSTFWIITLVLSLRDMRLRAQSGPQPTRYLNTPPSRTAPTTLPLVPHHVVYTVETTLPTIDVIYSPEGGGALKQEHSPTPKWTREFDVPTTEILYIVSVGGYNHQQSGSVTCTITVDGVVATTLTKSGGNVSASCAASVHNR